MFLDSILTSIPPPTAGAHIIRTSPPTLAHNIPHLTHHTLTPPSPPTTSLHSALRPLPPSLPLQPKGRSAAPLHCPVTPPADALRRPDTITAVDAT